MLLFIIVLCLYSCDDDRENKEKKRAARPPAAMTAGPKPRRRRPNAGAYVAHPCADALPLCCLYTTTRARRQLEAVQPRAARAIAGHAPPPEAASHRVPPPPPRSCMPGPTNRAPSTPTPLRARSSCRCPADALLLRALLTMPPAPTPRAAGGTLARPRRRSR